MYNYSNEKCPACGKEYKVKIIRYPAKLEDRRDDYYLCPYCNSLESKRVIRLEGNEDVEAIKL